MMIDVPVASIVVSETPLLKNKHTCIYVRDQSASIQIRDAYGKLKGALNSEAKAVR
jgi:hypothetical protein